MGYLEEGMIEPRGIEIWFVVGDLSRDFSREAWRRSLDSCSHLLYSSGN